MLVFMTTIFVNAAVMVDVITMMMIRYWFRSHGCSWFWYDKTIRIQHRLSCDDDKTKKKS